MAATDTLESYIASLSTAERTQVQDLLRLCRTDMFAARSEDARVRLVHDFIHEAHALLRTHRKG